MIPALGLDLDGTIDERPEFFETLSKIWPGKVYIVTCRKDRLKAQKDAARFGIRCDEVICVNKLEDKLEVIKEYDIGLYFDDQPECLTGIPASVGVFLVRNGGNYDYEDGKWMLSDQTGKLI